MPVAHKRCAATAARYNSHESKKKGRALMAKAKVAAKKPNKTAHKKEEEVVEQPRKAYGRPRQESPFKPIATTAANVEANNEADEPEQSGPQRQHDNEDAREAECARVAAAEKAKFDRDLAALNKLAADSDRKRAEDAAKVAAEKLAADAKAKADVEKKAIERAQEASKIALCETDDKWLEVAKAMEELKPYSDNSGKPAHDRLMRREEERTSFLQTVKPIGLETVRGIINGGRADAISVEFLSRVSRELSTSLTVGRYPIGHGEIRTINLAIEHVIRDRQPMQNVGTHPTLLAGAAPVPPPIAPVAPPVQPAATRWQRFKEWNGPFVVMVGIVLCAVMTWVFTHQPNIEPTNTGSSAQGAWIASHQPPSAQTTPASTAPVVRAPTATTPASSQPSACVPLRDMPGARCDETPGYAGDVNCAHRIRSFELREEVTNAQLAAPNVNTPRVFCPAGGYGLVNGSGDPIASGTYDYSACTYCPTGASPQP